MPNSLWSSSSSSSPMSTESILLGVILLFPSAVIMVGRQRSSSRFTVHNRISNAISCPVTGGVQRIARWLEKTSVVQQKCNCISSVAGLLPADMQLIISSVAGLLSAEMQLISHVARLFLVCKYRIESQQFLIVVELCICNLQASKTLYCHLL